MKRIFATIIAVAVVSPFASGVAHAQLEKYNRFATQYAQNIHNELKAERARYLEARRKHEAQHRAIEASHKKRRYKK